MFYLTIQDRFVNWSVFLLVTCGVLFTAATPCHTALTPDSIEETIGAERGICVILGENLGDRVLELARSSEVTFYVQSSDAGDVLQSRKEAAAEGLLSTRLYIEQGDSSRIHLADNLADAVIVSDRSGFKKAELFRVLLPGGKLITDGKVQLKPVLNGLGQWTHPYHGPDNNPLSEDRVAKAPFITQFLAEPYYGPMPAVTVTSGGRLFKAFGHISFKKREWAMVGKLVAMNAFNGVILW